MKKLTGQLRAEALDDLAALIFNGFVSSKDAELMANEASIRFSHLLDAETFATGIKLAGHRYVREFGHQPPQTEAPDDPVVQAESRPELKVVGGAVWPPLAAGMD